MGLRKESDIHVSENGSTLPFSGIQLTEKSTFGEDKCEYQCYFGEIVRLGFLGLEVYYVGLIRQSNLLATRPLVA